MAFGGLQPYDAKEWSSVLSEANEYTCLVDGLWIKEMSFVHKFPPGLGQIENVCSHLKTQSDDDKPLILPPIGVAAVCGGSPPQRETGLQMMSNEHVWYGFLMYFAEKIRSKEGKLVKKCTEVLRRIPVVFHLCPLTALGAICSIMSNLCHPLLLTKVQTKRMCSAKNGSWTPRRTSWPPTRL